MEVCRGKATNPLVTGSNLITNNKRSFSMDAIQYTQSNKMTNCCPNTRAADSQSFCHLIFRGNFAAYRPCPILDVLLDKGYDLIGNIYFLNVL